MMRIGVTGGMGSGKTTVCRTLEAIGVPVFYADDEVKKMYESDAEVRAQLIETFGEAVYNGGALNRKRLAEMVFGNDAALAALNAIAHPAVEKRFAAWSAQQSAPCVAQEAALMFESGAHRQLDKIVTVNAPEELRIRRVTQRDGCTRSEALRRMARQLSDAERAARADFCIVNDDATPLLPQILEISKKIENLIAIHGKVRKMD
ncbi:MAG: dephospho-CoA kinase [Prevotellaceae bacterium]|jgi:dephospho-CoA kinase|nr:dephospho-CoA kinase [Prevotellaceae bacterium]